MRKHFCIRLLVCYGSPEEDYKCDFSSPYNAALRILTGVVVRYTEIKLRCIWRNASTSQEKRRVMPVECMKRKCSGVFKNWKDVFEFSCPTFIDEKELRAKQGRKT